MAVLRLVEMGMRAKGNKDAIIPLPFVEGTIVLLGYGSIFLNIFFILTLIFFKSTKKELLIPTWLLWFNLLMLPIQIWYHFFSKI